MLQPRTAKLYVKPIEQTATAFVKRAQILRNSNLEVPEDFLNEIHKWSLECEYEFYQICMNFHILGRK
jgi:cytochrome P450 family 49 subfamily A